MEFLSTKYRTSQLGAFWGSVAYLWRLVPPAARPLVPPAALTAPPWRRPEPVACRAADGRSWRPPRRRSCRRPLLEPAALPPARLSARGALGDMGAFGPCTAGPATGCRRPGGRQVFLPSRLLKNCPEPVIPSEARNLLLVGTLRTKRIPRNDRPRRPSE